MQEKKKRREMKPDPTFEYFSEEELEEFENFFDAPEEKLSKLGLKLKAKIKNAKS